jgi:S-adenosylmethionine/arginine decarboxylase-like enzyme
MSLMNLIQRIWAGLAWLFNSIRRWLGLRIEPITAQHWMLDAWDVRPANLVDTTRLLVFCGQLVKALDMQCLGKPQVYQVDEKGTIWGRRREGKLGQVSIDDKAWGSGITILIAILDSSITLHTLSQFGRLYLDVFSCKPLPTWLLRGMAENFFGLKGGRLGGNYRAKLLKRG